MASVTHQRRTFALAALVWLALGAAGREAEALALVAGALPLAEPQGYVRLFAAAGEPMQRLLERAAAARPAGAAYLRRLLEAMPAGSDVAHTAPGAEPADELNDRELAILRLLAAGRSNREIAAELYLSVNTVKWHARHLYAKLGVNRRALAVARARELGIV